RQQMGEFDEAARLFRRALAAEPKLTSAWYGLVMSKRIDPEAERPALERLTGDDGLNDDQRRDLLFVLAHLDNDRKAYDAAFACFRAANDLRKKTSRFERARWSRLVSTLMASFPAEFFAARRGWGDDSELPVFVLGMPRSGTTLVEQIIASHPDAFGAGELYDIQHLANALGESPGGLPFPQGAPQLGRADVAALADGYLASLRRRAPGARRVVDKMPGNFLYLGLIALLFPRAKVVHCRRDPLDCCISCYFQNFRTLEFTSDLDDLGHYYREYERLMRHWQAALPLPILDVQYEQLIAAQAAESRRLVDFVGLPWDDRCLSFHETRREIRTASIWQARQPIYASSIGRWRPYEAHLGPLKRALGLEAE
ncbi:MAG: sulfotransferase, partial [Geminicoccales bacterium]